MINPHISTQNNLCSITSGDPISIPVATCHFSITNCYPKQPQCEMDVLCPSCLSRMDWKINYIQILYQDIYNFGNATRNIWLFGRQTLRLRRGDTRDTQCHQSLQVISCQWWWECCTELLRAQAWSRHPSSSPGTATPTGATPPTPPPPPPGWAAVRHTNLPRLLHVDYERVYTFHCF